MVYIGGVESRMNRSQLCRRGAQRSLMSLDRRVLLSSRDSVSGHLVNSILMCFCPGVQFSNGCEPLPRIKDRYIPVFPTGFYLLASVSPCVSAHVTHVIGSRLLSLVFARTYTQDRVQTLSVLGFPDNPPGTSKF